MMRKGILIGVVALLLLVGGVLSMRLADAPKRALADDVRTCNGVISAERFSCYRQALEQHYSGPPEALGAWTEENGHLSFAAEDTSYAPFGTNCHTFYHAVGDKIASDVQDADVAAAATMCVSSCTNGCIMGLYKRLSLRNAYSAEALEALYAECPEGSKVQCAHELGHVLHDKYTYAILQVVDSITEAKYPIGQRSDFAYRTFDEVDFTAPFVECESLVPEDMIAYCLTGIGHNQFLFADFVDGDYQQLFAECASVEEGKQQLCRDFFVYRVGINDVATKFLDGQFVEGRLVCEELAALNGEATTIMPHCYRGVGGGIGLFLDSEFSHVEITQETITPLRQRVVDAITLCEEAPDMYAIECYKGLLGTGLKRLYTELNLYNEVLEEAIEQGDDAFEVVG